MALFGIDPSLRGFAASIFDEKTGYIIDFIFIETESKAPILDRIFIITNNLRPFIIKNKIRSGNIETPYFNRFNPKVFFHQSRLYQEIISMCFDLDIELKEFEPKTVKKTLGKGNLNKAGVLSGLEQMWPKILVNNSISNLKTLIQEGLIDSIAIGLTK